MIEFKNEVFTDFSEPTNKKIMQDALAKVKEQLGQEYPLYINGEKVVTDKKITSINPGSTDQVVGYVSSADQELAEKAMQSALQAFESWKLVDPAVRAGYLFKAAAELRRRKYEFAAWMVYEAGKNWGEADADVAEAIDFLEFYAREMVRMGET